MELKILLLLLLIPMLLIPVYIADAKVPENEIPTWVVNVTEFLVENNITDEEFVKALQIIIDNKHAIEHSLRNYHNEFTMELDKTSYTEDDDMIFSGNLTRYGSSAFVMIKNSNDTSMYIHATPGDNNQQYSMIIPIGLILTNNTGTYTVIATSDNEELQTTIQYGVD